MIWVKSEDSNWAPRSVVMVDGTPKEEIQLEMKARAIDLVVISLSGIACGQRVKQSMMKSRYLYPCDVGSGPTMSMWRWSKRASGVRKVPSGEVVWR